MGVICNHSQRDVLNAVLKVVYALISFEVFIKLASYFSIKNLIFSTLYINYEDGFIRRGFFGAILFWFSKITNINPFYFQISLTIIVLLALIIWILRKFLNQKLNFYIFIGSFMLANVLAYNMFFFVEVYMILLSIILFTVLKQIEKPIYKILFASPARCPSSASSGASLFVAPLSTHGTPWAPRLCPAATQGQGSCSPRPSRALG